MTAHTKFALGTFERDDRPLAGLVRGQRVVDLERHLGAGTTIRQLVDEWPLRFPPLQALADTLEASEADYELGALRPLPPVLPCGQVFQAGANYRQHVLDLISGAEQRSDSSDGFAPEIRDEQRRVLDERARNGRPFVFQGSVHALVGAEDDIVLPPEHTQYDWEIELGVVIGRRARRVPRERAAEVIAGYVICNDVTTRDALSRPDIPGGIDWLAAKNSPTFLPTGPLLVPAAHVPDPMALHLTLRVNGRLMQDGSTADMLFDVARLIEHVSTTSELHAGDLLLTGSPAGNGAFYGVFLTPGDVVEGSITGLGTQRNRCVPERLAIELESTQSA
jgi:2-keto-4-pentenoate hydratase/2-oxohepta-3-ene-1,7-dioic acid hydratase in catechol pathway